LPWGRPRVEDGVRFPVGIGFQPRSRCALPVGCSQPSLLRGVRLDKREGKRWKLSGAEGQCLDLCLLWLPDLLSLSLSLSRLVFLCTFRGFARTLCGVRAGGGAWKCGTFLRTLCPSLFLSLVLKNKGKRKERKGQAINTSKQVDQRITTKGNLSPRNHISTPEG
jgi:hypothetical protein